MSAAISRANGESSDWDSRLGASVTAWAGEWNSNFGFSCQAARYHVRFGCLSDDASLEFVYRVWPIGGSESEHGEEQIETKSVSSLEKVETADGAIEVKVNISPRNGYYKRLIEVRVKGECTGDSSRLNNSGARTGSLHWWLSLGRGESGRTVGNLRIDSGVIDASTLTPAALRYDGGEDSEVTLVKDDSGTLCQVLAPQVFVDIVTMDDSTFEIRLYSPEGAVEGEEAEMIRSAFSNDVSLVSTSGLYSTDDEPYAIWRVSNPDGQGVLERIEISQTQGPDPASYVFSHAVSGEWELEENGGARTEVRSEEILTNGDQKVTLKILDADGNEVSKRVETVRDYLNVGPRTIEVVNERNGETQVESYDYYTSGHGSSTGQLKSEVRADGSWSRYTYDSKGRLTKTVSGWLDVAPGAAESQSVVHTTSYSSDGLTATMIEKTRGVETARSYFVRSADGLQTTRITCTAQGAAIDAVSNQLTVTSYVADGEYKGKVGSVSYSDGRSVRNEYQTLPDGQRITTTWSGVTDADGDFMAGTKTVVTTLPYGWELSREVTDITSDLTIGGYVVTVMDEYGRPLRKDYLDGTHEEYSYACCGVSSHRDRQGILTQYTYDTLGYQRTEVRNGITIMTWYDVQGRLLNVERKGSDDSVLEQQANSYNLLGELTASLDAAGNETLYSQSFASDGTHNITTTFADGGTRIEKYHRDGRMESVGGTSVRPVRYEYEVLSGGLTATKEIRMGVDESETEWVRNVYDFVGRLIRTEYPDGAQTLVFYNDKGQRIREVDPDGVTLLYWQSDDGSVSESAVDLNGNVTIDPADRCSKQVSSYSEVSGVGVVMRTELWMSNGGDYTLEAVNENSLSGEWARTISNGLTYTSETVFDGEGGWIVTNTAPDSSQTVNAYENGQLVSSVSPRASMNYIYDAHGRISTQMDASTGIIVTTTYLPGDLVGSIDKSGEVTTYENYTWRGVPLKETRPGGLTAEYSYSEAGDLLSIGGTAEYPVSFSYDPQGRKVDMTTSSGTTQWVYNPQRGWLDEKVHADATATAYGYTPAGRLATRTWARDIVTTYAYDAAGDLSGQAYSDGTPGYSYTRDVRGRVVGVTDSLGNREFILGDAGQILSESITSGRLAGVSLNHSYDSLLRREGLSVAGAGATLVSTTYGYDAGSRLTSVVSDGVQVGYSRLAASNRLEYKDVSNNGMSVMSVAYTYNGMSKLASVISTPQAGSAHGVAYQFDAAGRRSQVQHPDGSYWRYGYNDRSEVISGQRYWSDGTPVSGMSFGYGFDGIGNRLSSTVNGQESLYQPNAVNQYTSRTVPGVFDLFGLADPSVVLNVNEDAPLVRQGDFFHASVPAPNTQQPAFVPVTVQVGEGEDAVAANGKRFWPQSPEHFLHDADGNLLEDGRWLYTWDGENRLVEMQTRPEAIAAGIPGRRLSFGYDYMGRRVSKAVDAWHQGTWHPLHEGYFIHDGWNLVAEREADGTLIRTYAWGDDLSGSAQGAGGIGGTGGLVAIHDHVEGKTFTPAFDGNGNVIALVDVGDGTVAATYEYDTFGNLLMQTGAYALINPFRFSTKYTDNESGLLYYVKRYYNPVTGRWLSRDPIGERGGLNLSVAVGNDPINAGDYLGLLKLEFNAFINGSLGQGVKGKLLGSDRNIRGTWLPEPDPTSPWWFGTDNREFGGGTARLRSVSSKIMASDIGSMKGSNWIKTISSASKRIRKSPILGNVNTSDPLLESQRRTAKPSQQVTVKDVDACTTEIKVKAEGSYPFIDVAPNINYAVTWTLKRVAKGKIEVSVKGWHNNFPSYEGLVDSKNIYQYMTSETGPNPWNLVVRTYNFTAGPTVYNE